MKNKDDELSSQIISSYSILYGMLLFAGALLVLFPSFSFLLVLPFLLLCIKGIHSSVLNGIIVAVIWGSWLSLLFSPLFFVSPQLIFVSLYSPLVFISFKNTKKLPSTLEYCIQWVVWEIPLFIWIRLYSMLGWRALEV